MTVSTSVYGRQIKHSDLNGLQIVSDRYFVDLADFPILICRLLKFCEPDSCQLVLSNEVWKLNQIIREISIDVLCLTVIVDL